MKIDKFMSNKYKNKVYADRQKNGCIPPKEWKSCVMCGELIPEWIYGKSPITCVYDETGRDCRRLLRKQHDKKRKQIQDAIKIEKLIEEKKILTTSQENRGIICFHGRKQCLDYDKCLTDIGKWYPKCITGEKWR